ncbi:hypothetical protein PG987_014306 [Apiospora arundinis]
MTRNSLKELIAELVKKIEVRDTPTPHATVTQMRRNSRVGVLFPSPLILRLGLDLHVVLHVLVDVLGLAGADTKLGQLLLEALIHGAELLYDLLLEDVLAVALTLPLLRMVSSLAAAAVDLLGLHGWGIAGLAGIADSSTGVG